MKEASTEEICLWSILNTMVLADTAACTKYLIAHRFENVLRLKHSSSWMCMGLHAICDIHGLKPLFSMEYGTSFLS